MYVGNLLPVLRQGCGYILCIKVQDRNTQKLHNKTGNVCIT